MLRKPAFAVDLDRFILTHVSESNRYWDTITAFFRLIQSNPICGSSVHVRNRDNRAGAASPLGLNRTMNGLLKHLSNQTLIVSMDSQSFRCVNVANTCVSALIQAED